jgi:outer membrane receptor protein involved in Fe transport
MNKHNIIRSLKFICLLFVSSLYLGQVVAQDDIKKEVKVVKPYEPTLSGATKINLLPSVEDDTQYNVDLDYNYSINQQKMVAGFKVRPISSAKMVAPPLSLYYKTYLKLGMGNYFTPMAELSINSLRSKDVIYGINVNHLSSRGKVKLDNNEKVFAGYGNTGLSAYGKKIMRNASVSYDAGINTKNVYAYGYNPEIDTVLDKTDIKQNYLTLNAGLKLNSLKTDSNRFIYNLAVDYHYFQDLESNKENDILVYADFQNGFGDKVIGLRTKTNIISQNIDNAFNIGQVFINPYLTKATREWRFELGLNGIIHHADTTTNFGITPNINLQFNIIPRIMTAYLGANGKWEINSYRFIANQNPFILPMQEHLNAPSKYNLESFAGIKGNFSSQMSYQINGFYTAVKDMVMFANVFSDADNIGNQFVILRDDAEITGIEAELSYTLDEKIKISSLLSFVEYELDQFEYAWHKPSLTYEISGEYNLQDKIIAKIDFIGVGKRYANVVDLTDINTLGEAKELKGSLNVNLGAEYRYSKTISAFVNVYNLTGSNYNQWLFYPTQKFLLIAGFTYSL